MNIQEAGEYVKSLKWQYAKTYPQCPHEYTCLSWKPGLKQKMIEFAYFIRDNGYTEGWGKYTTKVINIGDMKYWTMDFPLENTDLINRAYIDNIFRNKMSAFVKSSDFQYVQGMCLDDIKKKMNQKELEEQQRIQEQQELERKQQELEKKYDLFGGEY